MRLFWKKKYPDLSEEELKIANERVESRLKGDLVNKMRQSENSGFFIPTDLDGPELNDNLASHESGFFIPTDLDEPESIETHDVVDISNLNSSLANTLLDSGYTEKEIERDRKFISYCINNASSGLRHIAYRYVPDGEADINVHRVLDATFDDNGGGQVISGERVDLDYRITFRNSSRIKEDDAIEFIKTLIREANDRGLNLRAKNYWEADAFILYLNSSQLLETVELLEDLKDESKYGERVSRCTRSFGETIPFSKTIGDNPYYGISMYATEKQRFSDAIKGTSSIIKTGHTFNEYVSGRINDAYNKLLEEYNGDSSMISVDELYAELNREHENNMGIVGIPLWLNSRLYSQIQNSKDADTAKKY